MVLIDGRSTLEIAKRIVAGIRIIVVAAVLGPLVACTFERVNGQFDEELVGVLVNQPDEAELDSLLGDELSLWVYASGASEEGSPATRSSSQSLAALLHQFEERAFGVEWFGFALFQAQQIERRTRSPIARRELKQLEPSILEYLSSTYSSLERWHPDDEQGAQADALGLAWAAMALDRKLYSDWMGAKDELTRLWSEDVERKLASSRDWGTKLAWIMITRSIGKSLLDDEAFRLAIGEFESTGPAWDVTTISSALSSTELFLVDLSVLVHSRPSRMQIWKAAKMFAERGDTLRSRALIRMLVSSA